jgi:hypothetical protein
MSIWEWASWANVVILGVGAPVVFLFFMRDLKSILACLTAARDALPSMEAAAIELEPATAAVTLEACQSERPPL